MNISDPYVNILQHMQSQGAKFNPPSICLGKVISADPLVINIGDLPLTKENFMIADYLLSSYSRQINIPNITANGTTTNGTISSIEIPSGTINFINGLNKDDMVACLATSNEQMYIVLCKVVSL